MPRKKTDQKARIAVVGDVHLGNHRLFGGKADATGLNVRGKLTIDTLYRAEKMAIDRGATTIYVAGDLFDNRRPEPAITAAARVLMDEGRWVVIPGNHDLVAADAEGGNTACQPLQGSAAVVKKPAFTAIEPEPRVFCVPFDARKPMSEVIASALEKEFQRGGPDALWGVGLVTHVGVVDDRSPPWLRDAPDAIHCDHLLALLKKYAMPVAFVGNYHKHQQWVDREGLRQIVQLGALNPTGFSDEGCEPGVYGGMALWDGENTGVSVEWVEVPGPRFVKLPSGKDLPDQGANVLFVRAEKPAKQRQDVEGGNAAYLFDRYEEVEPEPPPVEDVVPQAGKLLESAEQAVEEYVSKMVVPEGLDRAAVLAEVKRYWRQA